MSDIHLELSRTDTGFKLRLGAETVEADSLSATIALFRSSCTNTSWNDAAMLNMIARYADKTPTCVVACWLHPTSWWIECRNDNQVVHWCLLKRSLPDGSLKNIIELFYSKHVDFVLSKDGKVCADDLKLNDVWQWAHSNLDASWRVADWIAALDRNLEVIQYETVIAITQQNGVVVVDYQPNRAPLYAKELTSGY